MKQILYHVLTIFAFMHFPVAHGSGQINFDSAKDVFTTEQHLKNIGLPSFMDQVWAKRIDAPGIHSRYWVDQFASKDEELETLEIAYRNFGRELAKQIDSIAVDIYTHPEPATESERLDWLLNFANWVRKPGKFENYRIASRVEEAATIPLLRMIVNLDVPSEDIEEAFKRFWSAQDSAAMRASIIYEESGGHLDLRNAAKNAGEDDDGFEDEWIKFHRKAFHHFNNKNLHYSRDKSALKDDPIEYTFPLDDYDSFHLDSLGWELKLHKQVCVYRTEARNLRSLKEVFRFRKIVGMFPDVEIRHGESPRQSYETQYNTQFRQCWKQHKVYPGGAAYYYLAAKNNTFVDEQTRKAISRLPANMSSKQFNNMPKTIRTTTASFGPNLQTDGKEVIRNALEEP